MINRKSYKKVKYKKLNKTRKIRHRHSKVSRKKKGGGPRGWMGRRVTPKYKQKKHLGVSKYQTRKQAAKSGTSTSKFYTTTSRRLQKQKAKINLTKSKSDKVSKKLTDADELVKSLSDPNVTKGKDHAFRLKTAIRRQKKYRSQEKKIKEQHERQKKRGETADIKMSKIMSKKSRNMARYGSRKVFAGSRRRNIIKKLDKTNPDLSTKFSKNFENVEKLRKDLKNAKTHEDKARISNELKQSSKALKDNMKEINQIYKDNRLGKQQFKDKSIKKVEKQHSETIQARPLLNKPKQQEQSLTPKGIQARPLPNIPKQQERTLTSKEIQGEKKFDEYIGKRLDKMEEKTQGQQEQPENKTLQELSNMVSDTLISQGKYSMAENIIKSQNKFREARNQSGNKQREKKFNESGVSIINKLTGKEEAQAPFAPGGKEEIKAGDPRHSKTKKKPPELNIQKTTRKRSLFGRKKQTNITESNV